MTHKSKGCPIKRSTRLWGRVIGPEMLSPGGSTDSYDTVYRSVGQEKTGKRGGFG